MQENIQLEQLSGELADVPQAAADTFPLAETAPAASPAASAAAIEDLRRLSEVPVDVAVEIGRTRMTVGETLALHPGSIVTLHRTSGEPVDLLVNGTLIARGEVVVIDEQFGLRVTQVIGPRPEGGADAPPAKR